MERKTIPLSFEEMTEEEWAGLKVRRKQQNKRNVKVTPGGLLLPFSYVNMADHFYNFEFRSDDVVVATFPKSGTVWMAETLWALTNFDQINTMESTHINSRTHFIDLDFLHPITSADDVPLLQTFKELCPEGNVEDGVILHLAKADKRQRIIKTHLHFHLLNPSLLGTSKVVYIARNPKDACVSLYYFLSKRPDIRVEGDFSDFVQCFMEGKINYTPYWTHLKQAWDLRDHPNFHWVFYEDMKANVISELKKLQMFLVLDLTEDQLKIVADATSFENMKSRDLKAPLTKMEGSFFRKGTVGDWKNMASPELDGRMDQWIKENCNDIGIDFKYE